MPESLARLINGLPTLERLGEALTGQCAIVAALLMVALPAAECSAAAAGDLPQRAYELDLRSQIPMRDGVSLHAAVYRPLDGLRHPALFVVTPYTVSRWHNWAAYFAAHGYVFAIVDARGRGDSGGTFEPWIHEGEDGAEVVRWLAAQPFTDGRVAAWGGSYSGKNQWAIATLAGPALKTIAPAGSGYVGYDMGMVRNIPFPGMQRWLTYVTGRTVNASLNGDDAFWTAAYAELGRGRIAYSGFDVLSGNPNPIWKAWAAHPSADSFWARGTPDAAALHAIGIPVLAVTGAYDDAQLGTLRYWNEYQGSGPAKPNGYLVIGPWDHPGTREPKTELGGLSFSPASLVDMKQLDVDWYDWVLKGRGRPAFLMDHFVFYVAGAEHWSSASSLEAATAARERLFLASPHRSGSSLAERGALEASPPSRDRDSYVDDPSAPAFNEGPEGTTAVSPSFLTDDRIPRRLRGDGLIYDTLPFARDQDLIGRPSADMFISLDVPDADFRIQLYEVTKEGKSIFLGQDQIRARYRLDPARPSFPVLNRTEHYRFDQFPFVARRVRAGSVIRLVLCPLGASIHQQRNRHSGGDVSSETAKDNRRAQVTVSLGRGQSSLTLPFGAKAQDQ